tara:strand:- start:330 stop:692 length:363 start_codon:yes stop_codon:yes gene_type:complete
MAHFAKIGMNGRVIEVLKVNNEVILDADGNESEINGVDFLTKLTGWSIWKQTSYNGNIRKNYAGIGFTYDEDRDAFIPKKPFNSWILDEETCKWKPPVEKPDGLYEWNEENQTWQAIDNS